MRRTLADAASYAGVGGLAVALIAVVRPADVALAVDAYLLFLAALAAFVLTRLTRELTDAGRPSEVDQLVRRRRAREEPAQLPELARLEREVTIATVSAFDVHVRLRPKLRDVAAHRLLSRHGVALDEEPPRARELLGDSAWEIVRPDRQLPEDRHEPGVAKAQLVEIVESLERL